VFGGGIAVAGTYTRHRWLSNLLLSLPPLGISLPPFWIGLLLIQLFSFQLRLLPALGSNGFASLILPAITLALPTGAIIGQVLAKSLRTQLAEPYVEIALAKRTRHPHLRHSGPGGVGTELPRLRRHPTDTGMGLARRGRPRISRHRLVDDDVPRPDRGGGGVVREPAVQSDRRRPAVNELLTIRDLAVTYRTRSGPVHAVNGADLTVHTGQIVAVVGESGSGKSTTAHAPPCPRTSPGSHR
jgi:ABC-type multidrug transport system fused ATPase/permease subunit